MTPATLQQRRAPSQARGHQRVKALLDATALLLEEGGYDALTTKAIAERARTSIGSFYQFFPNRDAAVAALVDRYREEIRHYVRASVRDNFIGGEDRTGVEGLRTLFHSFPGFGRLFSSSVSEGSLGPHTERLRREVLDSLEELMGEAFPEVPEARRHRSMLMVVETARAVLGRIPYVDEATGATLRAELDEMLALYLAASFEPEHGAL